MRFGICAGSTDKETLGYIKSLGYDYIEGNFGNVQGMDESALREYISVTRDLDIAVESYCIFLKGDFRVVGPNTNHGDICEYAKIGFEKAARLGGKTVVFGSGGARRYPEGFPREKARDQFAECLRMCGDIAFTPPRCATVGPRDLVNCKKILELHFFSIGPTDISWQKMMSRQVCFGPVTPLVPDSLVQRAPDVDFYVTDLIASPIEYDSQRQYR